MDDPTYTVTISPDKAGLRLDQALAQAIPSLSRRQVQALLEDGRVRGAAVDDKVEADHRVRSGAVYTIAVPKALPPLLTPQPMPLSIVFEDEDLIVIDKPPGLVVHPGAGTRDGTLVNALLAHCPGALATIGGPLRPGIVHRLDKDTSGLMVIAKTDRAYHALTAQFARHTVERAYHALVWGQPVPAAGRVALPIGRSPLDRKKMAAVRSGTGKPAATNFRTLAVFSGRAALIECRLETGRTHQVRVHMAAIGHPLVGDPVYGGRRRRVDENDRLGAALAAFPRQALHAHVIGFSHPADGRTLRFESILQNDFKLLMDCLNNF